MTSKYQTATPRTDAFVSRASCKGIKVTDDFSKKELADFARTLETELQQLRLAADGVAEQLEAYMGACGNTGYSTLRETFAALYESGKDRIAAYRAAGEGKPKDTGTSRE